MEKINFEEIIIAGALFEDKIMSAYYELYKGQLSRPQAQALSIICDNPGVLSRDIAKLLGVPKQYASRIVQKLISDEFIWSEHGLNDGRTQLLFPSEKGRAFLDEHIAQSNCFFSERLHKLSDNESKDILNAFSVLRILLEKI